MVIRRQQRERRRGIALLVGGLAQALERFRQALAVHRDGRMAQCAGQWTGVGTVQPLRCLGQAPGQRGSPRGLLDHASRRNERGALITELVVTISILALVVIPLALGFVREQRICRACYFQAIAMEIVDGEMEVLAAGEWRTCPLGSHPYSIRAAAARNLPPGRFVLTREPQCVRLEWLPDQTGKGGKIIREIAVK